MENIVVIVLEVLIVLFVLGCFARGRFRAQECLALTLRHTESTNDV